MKITKRQLQKLIKEASEEGFDDTILPWQFFQKDAVLMERNPGSLMIINPTQIFDYYPSDGEEGILSIRSEPIQAGGHYVFLLKPFFMGGDNYRMGASPGDNDSEMLAGEVLWTGALLMQILELELMEKF